MRTTPQFVTPNDFYNYWGVDLYELLKTSANDSNKANLFLMITEDRVKAWIDAHTFRTENWEAITGERLETFQKAILTQAMYIFRNSDLSLDSGYDPEKGVIIDRAKLQSIVMSSATIDLLTQAGLNNRKIPNYFRYINTGYDD